MITDPRRTTAVHEAGHAVADVVLGIGLEYASIRPGRTFAGVAVPKPIPPRGIDAFDPSLSVTCQPEPFRSDVERRIVSTLAGPIAAMYLTADRTSGYGDVYGADEAAAIAQRALEQLGPRIAELVILHEEREEPTGDDETNARHLAHAIAGDGVHMFYLEWLRAEAMQLVERYRLAILRVADALERHAVLRGDQIAALVHPESAGSRRREAERAAKREAKLAERAARREAKRQPEPPEDGSECQ